jgi:hypothetical protein
MSLECQFFMELTECFLSYRKVCQKQYQTPSGFRAGTNGEEEESSRRKRSSNEIECA